MVQCFAKAGLPSGVVSYVTGKGSEIGDYLTTHPLVNCVSFTGGDTGIAICKKAGMVRCPRCLTCYFTGDFCLSHFTMHLRVLC